MSLNPFKSTVVVAPLVDQLASKQIDLEILSEDKTEEARELASLAAQASAEATNAENQSVAVAEAHRILLAAGVTL